MSWHVSWPSSPPDLSRWGWEEGLSTSPAACGCARVGSGRDSDRITEFWSCPCPVVRVGCSSGVGLSLCLVKHPLAGLWCSALCSSPSAHVITELHGCSIPCTQSRSAASLTCGAGGRGDCPQGSAGHGAGAGWSPGNLLALELGPLLFPSFLSLLWHAGSPWARAVLDHG